MTPARPKKKAKRQRGGAAKRPRGPRPSDLRVGLWPSRLPIRQLRTMFAEYNPRRISSHDYEELRWSIRTIGFVQNVVCNRRTREQGWPRGSKPTVVGGHQGVRASEDEGFTELPVVWIDVDRKLERKVNLALNRIGGEFIAEQVQAILRDLQESGDPLDHVGFTDDEVEAYLAGKAARRSIDDDEARKTLHERFVVPPFSILDARQGYWRTRKAAWLALGIRSELGRGAVEGQDEGASRLDRMGTRERGLLFARSHSGRDPSFYPQKRRAERRLGRKMTTAEFLRDHYVPNEGETGLSVTGTSVFDPVLCELVYRWFSGSGARVLDPFAGGSVRGIVAGLLGRSYVGVDLSAQQVKANQAQAAEILGRERAR